MLEEVAQQRGYPEAIQVDVRPHSSLGYRTPAEFAAEFGGEKGRGKDAPSANL
jgi:hypothetical protein